MMLSGDAMFTGVERAQKVHEALQGNHRQKMGVNNHLATISEDGGGGGGGVYTKKNEDRDHTRSAKNGKCVWS